MGGGSVGSPLGVKIHIIHVQMTKSDGTDAEELWSVVSDQGLEDGAL